MPTEPSAFPVAYPQDGGTALRPGLSKLEYTAIQLMAAMMASPHYNDCSSTDKANLAIEDAIILLNKLKG